MGQVLIRNLDDEVIAGLKTRAELSGKSLEQSLRQILTDAAPLSPDEKVALSRRLRAALQGEDWDTRAAIRWGRDDQLSESEGDRDP